jgi:uncharacterized protein (TIGR02588 family)
VARDREPKEDSATKRRLEAIAATIGAALTLLTLGVIVWDGVTAPESPPYITVEARGVHQQAGGFVLEVVAINRGGRTAAQVEVQGILRRDGEAIAESTTTFDHVPRGSQARGGLFFARDPREFELELRALGYSDP